MTKYSTEFKIKIVSEYLNNKNLMTGLSNKYKIPYSVIRRWIHQAQEKIIKQEAEIERLKLENLVLKKVAARYPRYPIKKKQ